MEELGKTRRRSVGAILRRPLMVVATIGPVVLMGVAGLPETGPAFAAAPTAGSTAAATALPSIPAVSRTITDGQNPSTMLADAIELSSVGVDTTALTAAIDATQAQMDTDAQAAAKAGAAVNRAGAEANRARASAQAAGAVYSSLQAAVENAAVMLYTDGPASLSVNPNAGTAALLYASDYADSTLSPYGALATRAADEKAKESALRQARSAQATADRDAAKAASALKAEQGQVEKLTQVLESVSSASAAEVEADHTTLAGQAGQAVLADSDLQFSPKRPPPAPLPSTPIALTWAFSELGKPYLWGGTGPKEFDCSGLTQFVWRAAGVSIPRVAAAQDDWTVPVPLSQLLPGDLVFFGTTDIHHVGIYVGAGLMINAPHTGTVVQVSSIWWSDLSGFGRIHAPGVVMPPHRPPSVARPAPRAVVTGPGPVPSQSGPKT